MVERQHRLVVVCHEEATMKLAASAIIILLLFFGAFAGGAHAQTVLNPKVVEFDPSADHAALNPEGQALVQRYELQIFLPGASSPMTTTDLGKPAPESDGKIRVDFSTKLSPWPLVDGTYVARVAAVGPGGTGVSDTSNTFAYGTTPPACTYAVAAPMLSFGAGASSSTVSVTTGTGCAWTAASSAAWLTLGAGATGSGSVALSVAANTSSAARTATATVAGQVLSITQAGLACSFSLSSSSASFQSGGGSSGVTVTDAAGCGWTASSNAGWLTVSPASGTGTGSLTLTAAANTTATPRSATVTAAGQTVSVTQLGIPCSYALSASSQSFSASGGSGSVTVTAPTGCAWNSMSSAAWLTVTGTSGASVSYAVAANTATTSRSGTLTIGGQTLTITQQAAVPCTYSLSATGVEVSYKGGSGAFTLTSGSGCAWTAASNAPWLTVSPVSGAGNTAITFTAARNDTGVSRTGTITVGGLTYTVSQPLKLAAPKGVRVSIIGG